MTSERTETQLLPTPDRLHLLRFFVLGLVLIASAPNIFFASFFLSRLRGFLNDTNPQGLYPSGTALLLAAQPLFVAMAIGLPLGAIAAMFLRGRLRPLLVVAAFLALAVAQVTFTTYYTAAGTIGPRTVGRTGSAGR